MFKLGIYFSIAIIALNLNGFQARSYEGDISKIPPNQIMETMLTLLNEIAKQNKCNIIDELKKTQMAMQKNSEETQIALQNQQADIQKSMGSQLETQINLEKDQKALMKTFKNIIPENFTERLIKMEEHETSLQETLNKISLDFDEARSVIHDQQDSVLAQLEVGINLEKDQKTQLETLTNTMLETSKKILENLEGRLDRMEKNQLDKQNKCNIVDELTKSQTAMQKDNEERLIAMQNQLTETLKAIAEQKSLLETVKNTIPENLAERLVKMEEHQTSLPEILKKILEDFEVKMKRNESETITVVTEPPKEIIIPPGFEKMGSRYFYIEEEMTKNWTDAQLVCREKGGYLAAIQDQEEFIAVVLKLQKDNRYWLGINDIENEGIYISDASGNVAPFLKWGLGDPNNLEGNEDCVGVVAGVSAMVDWPCKLDFHFICSLDNTV